MQKIATLLIAALIAIGLTWTTTSVALADEFQCTGTIGAETFENLFVPDGATCTLNGTRIDGNIKVGTGATLNASGVTVGGNIQAEGAASVTVLVAARTP